MRKKPINEAPLKVYEKMGQYLLGKTYVQKDIWVSEEPDFFYTITSYEVSTLKTVYGNLYHKLNVYGSLNFHNCHPSFPLLKIMIDVAQLGKTYFHPRILVECFMDEDSNKLWKEKVGELSRIS
jgi:hypothetical protein